MGKRLLILIVIATLVLPAGHALGDSFTACWVVKEPDSFGRPQTVTRCRIAGGSVVDYASDTDVPSILYAQTGTDTTGQCWYYTSAGTQYVILNQYGNGDAEIGYDIDPATPGGIVAIGPTLSRCTSEPAPAADPFADAWEYAMDYLHDPPALNLSPRPGDGVTGMDTYIGVPIPPAHTATLSSSGTSLDVSIEVSAVIVDWGDGTADSYPPEAVVLAGYPTGTAIHLYEQKNQGAAITVSYVWTAQWRPGAEAWQDLDVPNTATTLGYPVSEIVSRLGG